MPFFKIFRFPAITAVRAGTNVPWFRAKWQRARTGFQLRTLFGLSSLAFLAPSLVLAKEKKEKDKKGAKKALKKLVAENKKIFKRYCKTLSLQDDPKLIEEYKKVHAPGAAWPEITEGMRAVQSLLTSDFDHDQAMSTLATLPRQSEWEAFVARFQNTSQSASAAEKWKLMERIYELDQKKSYSALEGQRKPLNPKLPKAKKDKKKGKKDKKAKKEGKDKAKKEKKYKKAKKEEKKEKEKEKKKDKESQNKDQKMPASV